MDEALSLIGLSVLAALIALFVWLPTAGDDLGRSNAAEPQGPQNASSGAADNYSSLSDEEKLEWLAERSEPSTETLLNRATAYNDVSYCSDIEDARVRERCLGLVDSAEMTGGQNGSDESSEAERVVNQAVTYGEPELCDAIENTTVRDTCRDRAS
jgi:hypothetical protein